MTLYSEVFRCTFKMAKTRIAAL